MTTEHVNCISVKSCTNISPFRFILDPLFDIELIEAGFAHRVELNRQDLLFLNECIVYFCRESIGEPPEFTVLPRFSTHDGSALESCKIQVESYLKAVLDHPECVSCPELWIVLGSSPESHIVPRFLAQRDNLEEILELSERPDQLVRVSSTSVISTILRLIEDNPFNAPILSSGLTTISRVAAQLRPDQSKLLTDTNTLGTLFRLLASGTALVHLVRAALSSILENHPISMFVYFQRDGGLVELADMVATELPPVSLSIITEAIYDATRFSNDVCIAISDKSSVGVSLLNKLLATGRGTFVEIIVTTTLVNLLRKGFVAEYKQKISKVIFSIISAQKYFLSSNFFCPFKLANSTLHGPVLDDALIQFGCFLVSNRALNAIHMEDPDWGLNYESLPLWNKRLIQLLVTGTSLTESTRSIIAETFLFSFDPPFRKIDQFRDYYSNIKIWVRNFSWKNLSSKSDAANNFLIELNFQISSKSPGVTSDDILSIRTNLDAVGVDRLKRLVRKISDKILAFEKTHKLLVDEILATMTRLRQLITDAMTLRTKVVLTEEPDKIESELTEIEARLKRVTLLVERKEEVEFELNQAEEAVNEKGVNDEENSRTATEDSDKEAAKTDVDLLVARMKILRSELPKVTDELMKERSSLDEFVFSSSVGKLLESVAGGMRDLKKIVFEISRIHSVSIPQFVSSMESMDAMIAEIQAAYRNEFRDELFRVKYRLESVIDIVEEGAAGDAGGFITPDEDSNS